MVALAFLLGSYFGSRATARQSAELMGETTEALMLSHAATQATQSTVVLRAIRGAQQDTAAQTLETFLNFAVIELAERYTPARDYFGSAAQALKIAREYRAANPHSPALESVKKKVQAALATQVVAPNKD